MLPTKFQVSWPFGSSEDQKKRKIDFEDGGHLGFLIGMILAIFDLPIKIQVNWHLGSGEEVKITFSRWWPWRPSWNSDQNNFSYL